MGKVELKLGLRFQDLETQLEVSGRTLKEAIEAFEYLLDKAQHIEPKPKKKQPKQNYMG